jgi:hypothetical protein
MNSVGSTSKNNAPDKAGNTVVPDGHDCFAV